MTSPGTGGKVVARWPAWISVVAREAIKGRIPRCANTFEKLDKVNCNSNYRLDYLQNWLCLEVSMKYALCIFTQ